MVDWCCMVHWSRRYMAPYATVELALILLQTEDRREEAALLLETAK